MNTPRTIFRLLNPYTPTDARHRLGVFLVPDLPAAGMVKTGPVFYRCGARLAGTLARCSGRGNGVCTPLENRS